MKDESKNSEKSDDFEDEDDEDEDDEDYVEKGKNKKDQEECKTCGNYYNEDHNCEEDVARKPQESTKTSMSKTLGKRKSE